MIESIIYSLTKLDGVEKIMIFVEGEKLDSLPNSKKALPIELTKSYGINKVYDVNNIFTMDVLNLYYYINIDDNYMIGDEVYDIDDDRYISKSFLNDSKLHEIEREIRTSLLKKNKLKLKKKNTSFISIDSIENINFNIIKLLEEHKNVGIN